MTELAADLQRTLGDAYAIERELAPGGMSRLFLARDTALRRRVAIKVLPRSLVAVVSVDRFKREIMLAAGLQHPHIVPVLSAGEIDGLPYYVMPFVEGESLRARIARGPLSVRETVSVMKDVARALAYAHAQGVIHRDVKPDNVLLSAGAAMVADFGVAKAISASRVHGAGGHGAGGHGAGAHAGATITGMGISLGTPAYMAPEQVTADPSVGHRADLYALGVVAYEMLAGAPPFRGRSAQQVLASHVAEAPVPITTRRYDVPDALADLIMACLQKDPALRPKGAAEVVRALEDATTSSGAFEPPRLVPRMSRRQRQRVAGLLRPTLLGVAGVALLAAVAWSVARRDADDPGPAPAAAPGAAAAAPGAAGIGVAVLPLANLGAERADSVLAQGLTSAFIDAIGGMGGVRVASLTASRAAAAGAAGPAEIGRALDASFLVEGTVQRQGDRVRVTVRLVRAGDGAAVWSQALDRTADGDLLALQDDVTGVVAAALAPRLGAAPAVAPTPAAPATPPTDTAG